EQQSPLLRVFPNSAQKCRRVYPGGDRLPCGSVIASAIEIRLLIIQAVTVHCSISLGRIETRCLDKRNLAPTCEPPRADIAPGLTAIARDVNHACVAPRPDQLSIQSRRSNGEHRTQPTFLGVLNSYWRLVHRRSLRRAREVRTDR